MKEQFIQYIQRPLTTRDQSIDDLQLDEHIPWYFAQMIFQSASNGAILLMQDLLNVDIRMNYPGKGK